MGKKLSDILNGIDYTLISGNTDTQINSIKTDSRQAGENDLFVAIKGTQTDGHKYIHQALEKGASAVVCETCPETSQATIIQVANSQVALAKLAANFYGNPSEQLTLIGVTGTNGKTTTATTLYNLFKTLGYKAGLLSTVRYLIDGKELPATHTTPDAITINKLLRQMVDAGCQYAFMEVSSHALSQHRTDFLDFDGAIFTNITHDHLDYHGTFKNYLYAKKTLFDNLKKDAFALVNADDRNAKIVVQNTKANVYTYGLKNLADFRAKILEKHFDGTLVLIDNMETWINFAGNYNVQNILAVYATARLLGFEKNEILTAISMLKPVDGRFEIFKQGDVTAIVDYAHTPDALEKILNELRDIRSAGERIITVIGAGGNRDTQKRPKMGKIAATLSDVVILTSDNPRYEDPDGIIKQIKSGIPYDNIKNVLEITDRKQAIKTALTIARQGDIVLIAGKGHETYQEIKGVKHHFDDREIICEFFENSKT